MEPICTIALVTKNQKIIQEPNVKPTIASVKIENKLIKFVIKYVYTERSVSYSAIISEVFYYSRAEVILRPQPDIGQRIKDF